MFRCLIYNERKTFERIYIFNTDRSKWNLSSFSFILFIYLFFRTFMNNFLLVLKILLY